jgi:cyclopropane fatty-acyl-phospholipid synthase-like methyltransferase
MIRKLIFNLWYYREPPWDTGISPPELMQFIQNHPSGRALDLGCGTGTNVITLAQHGWLTTGVDFAWRAIRIAHQKARRVGVQVDLRVDDVTRLENLSGPFDLILDIGCFHSLQREQRERYIRNLIRLLTPSGTYLLYIFFKDNPESNNPGLVESDLQTLLEEMNLTQRVDGTERGRRPSAWLTLQKKVV